MKIIYFILGFFVVGVFLFFGFSGESDVSYVEPVPEDVEASDSGDFETSVPIEVSDPVEIEDVDWKDTPLKDVISGEVFRVSDFDKPVVLESFAVWCPTCKKQQDEIMKLIADGDDSVHVSIDTDPNEDEAKVAAHVNRYSYDWNFVVFPIEATRYLIEEFGVDVVNAPKAPVIVVCPGGTSRLLGSGVKSAAELRKEIDKC